MLSALDEQPLSETVLRYLLEQAPMAILVLDGKGVIHEANRYAQALMGPSILGRPFHDILVDFTTSFNLLDQASVLDKEHLLNVRTSAGLPQTLYFSFSHQGDQILALGRIDVNELDALRKQLILLNNELSNLTRELQKKNAELSRLNQLKNQFLGMAAHDLRKPIGLIMSYSEFLHDEIAGSLNDEQLGFLETISSSSGFMKTLIDDFLDIAVIESGKFEMDLQSVDVKTLIHNSIEMNKPLAKKNNVSFTCNRPDTLPMMVIDGPKIEQVLQNLISNAIGFSPANARVTIDVSTSPEDLIISVRDEGPGMGPEDMARLFRPFGKTGAKKTTGERSTGLGLVIAKKMVEGHHGRIWVESAPGKGTTFAFSLPLHKK